MEIHRSLYGLSPTSVTYHIEVESIPLNELQLFVFLAMFTGRDPSENIPLIISYIKEYINYRGCMITRADFNLVGVSTVRFS